MSTSNKDYINELIAKAKKSWEGVDVDSYMKNLRDDSIDKEVAEKLSKEVTSYIMEQVKHNMKTIEERAKEYAPDPFLAALERKAYIAGATKQKDEDTVKACNIFCHIGCPHETDDYDCLKDKCAAWKKFRKMMEE